MGDLPDGVLGAPSVESDSQFEDPAAEPEAHSTDPNPYTSPSVENDSESFSDPSPESQPAAQAGPGFTQPSPDETSPDETAIAELAAAVQRVEQQAKAFHARAENYEQLIRQMQSRIEQLQGDQVQALLKPVIQRFASLHAQAMEASAQAHTRGEAAEKDFDFFTIAIEEALGLVDIESVAAEPSAEFDPGKHHASRIVPTDDPALDRRIQRVLRQGFTYAGAARVFLPAQVSIYRYEPPNESVAVAVDGQSPADEPGEGAPGE